METDTRIIKTVAIVGSGALGLYYGGRIARAGFEVSFLARGEIDALRAQGVAFSHGGERHVVRPAGVAAAPGEIGPVDLVLITLKSTANDALPQLLPPLLVEHTAVVNLQNGLGVDEQVAAVVGAARVLGAICFVGVNRIAPAEVDCSEEGYVTLGEYVGAPTARTEAVGRAFTQAGVRLRQAPSLLAARWHKLIWNVPFNGLAVVEGGMTTDVILADPAREARVRALMGEVCAIARAEGVEIADTFIDDQRERTRAMRYKPSTMLDYLAGKPLEIEPIWGEPLRRARRHGVPAPELTRLHAELLARAQAR